ncbi:MAG TPA: hypothetical protein VI749_02030 [Candidatus Omnitrophota bacterium]|nr:hypothetical protein [Candidatus Omnitrophota bacterium]
MPDRKPLEKSKSEYTHIIERIKADSNVGIDAQYTHAIIIEYLDQLTKRVERLEQRMEQMFHQ